MTLPPFWVLVQDHADELFRYARRLTGDRDAEDVLQEALLRSLRSYPRLTHSNNLRAWLFRVVTTTAYDFGRKRRSELPVDTIPEAGFGVEHDDGAFESLIERLSDGAKEAMRLRFIADLPYEQIGSRLGCSTAAARQRVSTGVKELRRSFDGI